MAGISHKLDLNNKGNRFIYSEQPGNREFQRDPITYGYWDVNKEEEKRNSVDYWNDRADNLMDRPRRGGTHILTDSDLAESIRRSQDDRGDFEGLYIRGGIKRENIPTYHDLAREQMWRNSIREANGDPDKIAAINNDYVRQEWDEYNQRKKSELESINESYTDWLRDTYGSDVDPVQNWRPGQTQAVPIIRPQAQSSQILNEIPVSQQDNTRVVNPTLHRMAEDGIRRRNL